MVAILAAIINLYDPCLAFEQDKCKSALSESKKLFNEGQFDKVIDLLTPCLTKGFSKEEKIEAYRLLALIYIEKDSLDKSKDEIEKMLYLYYNYEPDLDEDPSQFVELVNELKAPLIPPLVVLAPIDFSPSKKGSKWSNKFVNSFQKFIYQCPSIEYITYLKDLKKMVDVTVQDSPHYAKLNNKKFFLLSGSGQRKSKIFVLDIFLKIFPEGIIVWRDSVKAPNEHSLADSVGVGIVEYFGYKTRFLPVKISMKKFSLFSGIFAVSTIVFHLLAGREKSRYQEALTSDEASKSFPKLRTYESLRYSFGISLATYITYSIMRNPKKPIFEKIERK
ncbi:MAG: hypothetical protein ACFFCW_20215 [Candidatus Hodarchaeota archaeon]